MASFTGNYNPGEPNPPVTSFRSHNPSFGNLFRNLSNTLNTALDSQVQSDKIAIQEGIAQDVTNIQTKLGLHPAPNETLAEFEARSGKIMQAYKHAKGDTKINLGVQYEKLVKDYKAKYGSVYGDFIDQTVQKQTGSANYHDLIVSGISDVFKEQSDLATAEEKQWQQTVQDKDFQILFGTQYAQDPSKFATKEQRNLAARKMYYFKSEQAATAYHEGQDKKTSEANANKSASDILSAFTDGLKADPEVQKMLKGDFSGVQDAIVHIQPLRENIVLTLQKHLEQYTNLTQEQKQKITEATMKRWDGITQAMIGKDVTALSVYDQQTKFNESKAHNYIVSHFGSDVYDRLKTNGVGQFIQQNLSTYPAETRDIVKSYFMQQGLSADQALHMMIMEGFPESVLNQTAKALVNDNNALIQDPHVDPKARADKANEQFDPTTRANILKDMKAGALQYWGKLVTPENAKAIKDINNEDATKKFLDTTDSLFNMNDFRKLVNEVASFKNSSPAYSNSSIIIDPQTGRISLVDPTLTQNEADLLSRKTLPQMTIPEQHRKYEQDTIDRINSGPISEINSLLQKVQESSKILGDSNVQERIINRLKIMGLPIIQPGMEDKKNTSSTPPAPGKQSSLPDMQVVAQIDNKPVNVPKKEITPGTSPIDNAQELMGKNENNDTAVIESFLKAGGADINPSVTAWCAAFVNASLAKSGLPTTNSLAARSFLTYGEKVDSPQKGDIVVFSRGGKNSYKGHVGFFMGYDAQGNIQVLGGNQRNSVNISSYKPDNLLGFRRPPQT